MFDPAPLTACPSCSYDLVGLPSGRCPECGREFYWGPASLKRRRFGWSHPAPVHNRLRRGVALMVLAVFTVTLLRYSRVLGTFALEGGCFRSPDSLDMLCMPAAMAWVYLVLLGQKTLHRRPWLALVAVLPWLNSLGSNDPEVFWRNTSLVTWINAGFAYVAMTVPFCTRLRHIGMSVVGGLLLFVGGNVVWLFGTSLVGYLAGWNWSSCPDPRSGQVHQQYRLTNAEALVVLSPLVVVVVVVSMLLWRWARHDLRAWRRVIRRDWRTV